MKFLAEEISAATTDLQKNDKIAKSTVCEIDGASAKQEEITEISTETVHKTENSVAEENIKTVVTNNALTETSEQIKIQEEQHHKLESSEEKIVEQTSSTTTTTTKTTKVVKTSSSSKEEIMTTELKSPNSPKTSNGNGAIAFSLQPYSERTPSSPKITVLEERHYNSSEQVHSEQKIKQANGEEKVQTSSNSHQEQAKLKKLITSEVELDAELLNKPSTASLTQESSHHELLTDAAQNHSIEKVVTKVQEAGKQIEQLSSGAMVMTECEHQVLNSEQLEEKILNPSEETSKQVEASPVLQTETSETVTLIKDGEKQVTKHQESSKQMVNNKKAPKLLKKTEEEKQLELEAQKLIESYQKVKKEAEKMFQHDFKAQQDEEGFDLSDFKAEEEEQAEIKPDTPNVKTEISVEIQSEEPLYVLHKNIIEPQQNGAEQHKVTEVITIEEIKTPTTPVAKPIVKPKTPPPPVPQKRESKPVPSKRGSIDLVDHAPKPLERIILGVENKNEVAKKNSESTDAEVQLNVITSPTVDNSTIQLESIHLPNESCESLKSKLAASSSSADSVKSVLEVLVSAETTSEDEQQQQQQPEISSNNEKGKCISSAFYFYFSIF